MFLFSNKSTQVSQDKSYPVSPGFLDFLLRNMVLFLCLASLLYFLPSGLPSPHLPPKPVLKVSPRSVPFEVMWHDIEIQAFLVQKVWLLHRVGFYSPVMIEKCSNLRKNLERFNLYVTADLVTVCIGSTVQTLAEKEKQSMENTWREATSCYSNTSVLLKQRNHFCAFKYLSTIGEERHWRELFSFTVLPHIQLSFSYIPVQNSPANTYKFFLAVNTPTSTSVLLFVASTQMPKQSTSWLGTTFTLLLKSCSQSCHEKWVMAGWTVPFHHPLLLLPMKIYQSFHS